MRERYTSRERERERKKEQVTREWKRFTLKNTA
jgi:hypothetical protein